MSFGLIRQYLLLAIKFLKKHKEVELRLRINYEEVLAGNEKVINKLICESILRGIDIAEHELKIKEFDFDLFRQDLKFLFSKEGWI